ncbi:1818_t:CDS:2 [Funneliformis mosseae]|uniref:1818_t:CDS:1 n=1 Tax=Funneliformis mosseae TaxID=27381 RepID=A0A9N9EMV6_FUNMO|nr:1818_t:CDS:2 [Funneliformis mosseae]
MDNSIVQVSSSKFRVPHVLQQDSFDCGIACVCMVLRGLGFVEVDLRELNKQVAVSSIWTIDLAFLFRYYVPDLDFTYYTSYAGVRTQYRDNEFYRSTFDEDERRVNRLFPKAKNNNVNVVQMVLPLEDFKRFLFNSKFAIIALVNSRLLKCQLCQTKQLCWFSLCNSFDYILDKLRGCNYAGHFIVLIGFDPNTDCLIYRDPGITERYCMVSMNDFELARRSYGTDEDCIVIRMQSQE